MDDLRSQIVDLEALTSCARKAAEQLPYLPRPNRHAGAMTAAELDDAVEARRNYGRLQSLVFAAADGAEQVLAACEDAIDRAVTDDEDDDDDNGGGGSGSPAGNGQPGGPGSPGALTRDEGSTTPTQTIPAEPIPPLA